VIRQWPLAAYSALALPLAMAMLPIYMLAPKYYGQTFGLGLATLGATLFLVRLVDTIQDPFIGRLVDWLSRFRLGWPILMVSAAVALAIGFVLLFSPPVSGKWSLLLWLAASLVLVYTAHSFINVCYLAWGARLTDSENGRARVTAWREAGAVIGVVLASVLPVVWVSQVGEPKAYWWFSLLFVTCLFVGLAITLLGSPRPLLASAATQNWRKALSLAPVRRLYLFYLFNATSVAIPATLILFFVDDVLQSPGQAGLFLAAYFLAGLLTLPLWVSLSDRVGKARAWLLGSALASIALILAATLGEGDVVAYALICVLSGTALGADLALPPAMLADAIPPDQRSSTGLYFGVWALIAKFSLALAAGASLPLLGWIGYVPGQPETAGALSLLYAVLPVAIKLMAVAVLFSKGFDRTRSISEPLS
jgi:glycoside/pentoside/hexuronide:cation symporter, GPH family